MQKEDLLPKETVLVYVLDIASKISLSVMRKEASRSPTLVPVELCYSMATRENITDIETRGVRILDYEQPVWAHGDALLNIHQPKVRRGGERTRLAPMSLKRTRQCVTFRTAPMPNKASRPWAAV